MSTFRCLMSYHYIGGKNRLGDVLDRWFGVERDDVELFIDSGAFSAWSQGAAINVHDYGRWLRDNDAAHEAAVLSNLDVIGRDDASAQRTYDNQKILEDTYGLPILPVVHAGEPLEWIDRYIAEGYTYIAIGGLVGQPWKSAGAWVNQAFKRARCHGATPDDRADSLAVFHGFGLTSQQGLRDFPWYSVDSSSWGSGYRYGLLKMFVTDPRHTDGGPSIQTIPLRDLTSRGADSAFYRSMLRDYGFDPDLLLQPGRAGRDVISAVAAIAFHRQEQWLRDRWGPVSIPAGDPATGMRLYLADGAPERFNEARRGLRMYAADTAVDNLASGCAGLRLFLATSSFKDFEPARAGMRGTHPAQTGEPRT